MPNRHLMLPSSFRDPNGFLFEKNNRLYRQVNTSYVPHFEHLISSGLCEELERRKLLIGHQQVSSELALNNQAHCVLEPERVPFISYPYEWCFSQLKDAALTTLTIQKIAFEHGMVLKDASAYNIQFHQGRAVFIDTLSFETYVPGQAWTAYRQFCQHFLAPLALMSLCDIRLRRLLRTNIDGIPLDLAVRILGWRARLRPSLLLHLCLHAKSQQRYADSITSLKQVRKRPISRLAFMGLIDSLETAIGRLTWKPGGTTWGTYYQQTNYTDAAMEAKKQIVAGLLTAIRPETTWDLGANTGVFSRIAAEAGSSVVAMDIDPAAVEQNYLAGETASVLPLLFDLCNPSPSLGWANEERMSLEERGPADAVLALALIHHLAISNNVPLYRVAEFLSHLGKWLIIEFVPKEDSQVKRLLAGREDIFPRYDEPGFESAFGYYFEIVEKVPIAGTLRTMYRMKAKGFCHEA
jgi:ribosomal protein L11 methylase PrmA